MPDQDQISFGKQFYVLLPLVHNISLTLIEFASVRKPDSLILTHVPPETVNLLSQVKKLPHLKETPKTKAYR